MKTTDTPEPDPLTRLQAVLDTCTPAAVAVSGGVDSMTLAFVAHRRLGSAVTMFHAVSPAVPPAATARVKKYAADHQWQLEVRDAGEFNDPNYRANPANRCFYCKTNLYGTLAQSTTAQLLSGTNLDDLGDWRPGLKAAKSHRVRHPFVEADIDKATVRALAREHRLIDLAELPAAPCLSSRVETGIRIQADVLRGIDRAETLIREELAPRTVRCRVRQDGITVELDSMTLERLGSAEQATLRATLEPLFEGQPASAIRFAAYQRGSAFLRDKAID